MSSDKLLPEDTERDPRDDESESEKDQKILRERPPHHG
jgi:hypothetical protein